MLKTYHIYMHDKCLFKDLNEDEFNLIWNRLYTSYWTEEVTYVEVTENTKDLVPSLEESSY
ncbi:MAG: hypothetical protein CMB29_05670 [Euryarchaeota archaeon]|nr:hypothetical protein [Euryarchaeota archaeon]|tara:strand:+ start:203 stop:385 length:183 start_codon:yes stop_codon:yes gene_type:complete